MELLTLGRYIPLFPPLDSMLLHGLFGFISWGHFNTNEWHAWLCVRTAVSRSLVLIIFVAEVTYSEMLKTVIKFHRLKYVRGKNKKTWLTMVLESTGSVAGEEGSGLGLLQAAFGRVGWRWEGKPTLWVHLLHLADVIPWEQMESVSRMTAKHTPEQTVWPHGEKLDTKHLTCTHPHQTHPPETEGGWLSFETDCPITSQRCNLGESC